MDEGVINLQNLHSRPRLHFHNPPQLSGDFPLCDVSPFSSPSALLGRPYVVPGNLARPGVPLKADDPPSPFHPLCETARCVTREGSNLQDVPVAHPCHCPEEPSLDPAADHVRPGWKVKLCVPLNCIIKLSDPRAVLLTVSLDIIKNFRVELHHCSFSLPPTHHAGSIPRRCSVEPSDENLLAAFPAAALKGGPAVFTLDHSLVAGVVVAVGKETGLCAASDAVSKFVVRYLPPDPPVEDVICSLEEALLSFPSLPDHSVVADHAPLEPSNIFEAHLLLQPRSNLDAPDSPRAVRHDLPILWYPVEPLPELVPGVLEGFRPEGFRVHESPHTRLVVVPAV
mmetsp:Transcript_16277/g.33496  ORF Transcript_16277/g.33496 Transcript_16277/m.33496 type:complete len:340 (+) Transcript_16277:403-1422(+)